VLTAPLLSNSDAAQCSKVIGPRPASTDWSEGRTVQLVKWTCRSVASDTSTFPLITVGVTCFNSERMIERAIRSALGQRWPTLEVLVVDDASTDASPLILERMAPADPRIRILLQ